MNMQKTRAWRARERQAQAANPTDSEGYPLRPMGQHQWDMLADRMGAAAERALDAAQHGTPERKAEAMKAEAEAQARANQENPWEAPPLWDQEPMSPEDEEQQSPAKWWEPGYIPETPQAAPAQPRRGTSCGRCGAEEIDAELDRHLRWECTAQEAWIEAAINDRKARPDRYRKALQDRKAQA